MEFYLPPELQRLIQDFARPCTRPDWRQGSAVFRTLSKKDARNRKIRRKEPRTHGSQFHDDLSDKFYYGKARLAWRTKIVTNDLRSPPKYASGVMAGILKGDLLF